MDRSSVSESNARSFGGSDNQRDLVSGCGTGRPCLCIYSSDVHEYKDVSNKTRDILFHSTPLPGPQSDSVVRRQFFIGTQIPKMIFATLRAASNRTRDSYSLAESDILCCPCRPLRPGTLLKAHPGK